MNAAIINTTANTNDNTQANDASLTSFLDMLEALLGPDVSDDPAVDDADAPEDYHGAHSELAVDTSVSLQPALVDGARIRWEADGRVLVLRKDLNAVGLKASSDPAMDDMVSDPSVVMDFIGKHNPVFTEGDLTDIRLIVFMAFSGTRVAVAKPGGGIDFYHAHIMPV